MRRAQIEGPSVYLKALQEPANNLRRKYKGDPLGLAARLGLSFPEKPVQVMERIGLYDPDKYGPITPGLREMILELCLGEIEAAAAVAGRGSGKSLGAAFVEFYKVMIEDFDAINLGGSELQADQVYQYLLQFLNSDPYWMSLVKDEPMQSQTNTVYDAWIKVLAASQKSARSPHAGGLKPGGREAGGLLVIDEEAEAEEKVVSASLSTVNTARPSVVLRCSTFHNIAGSFANLIDHHAEMGFKLFDWTVFDVASTCGCQNECQSEEQCFREDHTESFVDPETGKTVDKLVHRAFCGNKAMYADGWIPMREIEKLWRHYQRNHATWDVEAMGSRPISAGHVIKDQMRFSKNITSASPSSLYLPGAPVTVLVDWGTANAGLEVWQEQPEDHHVLLHADLVREAGQTQIFGLILGYCNQYMNELTEVAADIGGGGNYLNPKLRDDHGIPVRDVSFSDEKESAVAAWNIYNEAGKTVIPSEFEDFIYQVRGWKRANGRIVKRNDHLCDAAICYFSKFVGRLNLPAIRIVPKSFDVTGRTPNVRVREEATGRIPVARSISRGR